MYREQNAQHNHNRETANQLYEDVAKFKYLGAIKTKKNHIQEETKITLNSGTGC